VAAGGRIVLGSVPGDIARTQGLSLGEARRAMLDDARVAEVAVARGLAARDEATWAATTALARAELRAVWRTAESEGDVRPTERDKLRVIHAVVQRSAGASEARMRDIAEAVRSAVEGARNAGDFEAGCKRVAREYPAIRVERLPPFDATGASEDGASVFDVDFVAAAWDLRAPGDTSDAAKSQFGWHVIRLLERIAGQISEPPSREFREAVFELRARRELRAILRRKRLQALPEEWSGAESVMAEAVVRIL
jgi:hypothetical protein